MPFFPKNYEEMVSQGLNALRNNTNITQLSPGSKARFIIESIRREQANQHALFDQNLMQAFVRWAEGKFLDFFGDIMKVPRLEATNASADAEHANFLFYVDSGTFGDINGNIDFVIPAGTEISTVELDVQRANPAAQTTTETKIRYTTTTATVCYANNSFVYTPIRASVEGKASDVARDTLKRHTFTAYVLSGKALLKCRNKYAITNGRDRESDASYRYRLMNAFKAKEKANRMAVRLAALAVPGVADVAEVNFEQGPGTYSLYIRSLAPTVSPGLTSSVVAAIEAVSAFGVRPFVFAPSPVGLEFVIALRWKADATEAEKVLTQGAIRSLVEDYLNGYGAGINIDLDALAEIIVTAGPKISGMGYLNPGKFEEIYVHRSSPDGEGTKKTLFTGTIVPVMYNERAMLETSTRFRGIQFL